MKRLSSLDYLRGLAAFGIMVFHYAMWNFGLFKAEDFLGRIGLYGVAIFYVLSGITLHHVYFDKIGAPSKDGLKDFAAKRLFRIFPLLWLLSLITLLLKKEEFKPIDIFLNFTGLFSVYHWKDSIAYGGWSIANELAFYLFFPVFVFLTKKSKILISLFAAALLLVYLWFAFVRLESDWPLGDYLRDNKSPWQDYTNPLNQVLFFLGGYMIAHLFRNTAVSKALNFALIALCLLVFILFPAKDDSMHLITGIPRLVFTAISITICFTFYKTDFALPRPVHAVFSFLGDISYALYLVHPVIWYILSVILKKYYAFLAIPMRMATGFVLSILAAWLLHEVLERPFMDLGRKVSRSVTRNRPEKKNPAAV